jgi:hypothetical protein
MRLARKRWCRSFYDINDCLFSTELEDVRFVGPLLTWCNKQEDGCCISRKMNRALANDSWNNKFARAEVEFIQRAISDHSACIVRTGIEVRKTRCYPSHQGL